MIKPGMFNLTATESYVRVSRSTAAVRRIERALGLSPRRALAMSSSQTQPQAALRYVQGTKKSPQGTFYLQCHVKPGASKQREGVTSLTNEAVELCVAAQAKEGEANKAVVKVLSQVSSGFAGR